MTDTTASERSSAPPAGAGEDRLHRFDEAVADLGHKSSAGDRRWAQLGLGAMILGVVISIFAYASSTGQSDTRDVLSSGILAVVGLGVVVAGAAVFVRSSLVEFLRFWVLRVLLAQSDHEK